MSYYEGLAAIRFAKAKSRRNTAIVEEAKGAGWDFRLRCKDVTPTTPVKRRCVMCDQVKEARKFRVTSASCKACAR